MRQALLSVLLGISSLGFGPPTLSSLDPFGPSFDLTSLDALRTVPELPVRATAAAVIDGGSGRVLLSSNADARLAPASLTKMMTALVAMDRAELGAPILATERSMTEPVVIGLDPGERMSLEDILYGLLLPSGNDAALAIAETLGGGSIEQFVARMNERAATLDLRNTHFVNPHGLDAPGHYSSARDLGETARALLNVPALARIVATERYPVGNPLLYLFLNSNPLLGFYDGADGVKTGYTDDAGRTFVASATRNGQRVIVVLLNSPDIRTEASRLLDVGFSLRMARVEIARPGFAQIRAEPPTLGGRQVRLAGWELPFLRGFTTQSPQRTEGAAYLEGRPLARWSE